MPRVVAHSTVPPGFRERRATVALRLLEKQRAFVESVAGELLYSGAFGAGKTRALCTKVLALAMRYPGTTIGLCRRTLVSLKATTLRSLLDEVLPPELVRWHNKSERLIAVRSGPGLRDTAYIHYFGLRAQSGESYNIRSLNLGACGVDEGVEITEQEWDEVRGRCRDWRCGLNVCFTTTNPGGRGHWMYRRFFLEGKPGEQQVIQTSTFDNPYLPAVYKVFCDSLKGRYRDRYVLGKWVDFEGLVYDCFDPMVHLLTWEQFAERFGGEEGRGADGAPCIPPSWPRERAIDFGYTNPFVCQWWAEDADARSFLYREIYHTRRLVSVHGEQIVAQSMGEPIVATYADHDAEGRATLEDAGVSSLPANKAVKDGIESAYELLQPDPLTGEPRLFFLRDTLLEVDPYLVAQNLPTRTVEELGIYQYPKGTGLRNPTEDPIKLHDHGCDALRYRAHTRKAGGEGAGGLWRYMADEARRMKLLEQGRR